MTPEHLDDVDNEDLVTDPDDTSVGWDEDDYVWEER
ncbi:MAG: hypothetical protein JWQ95_6540 [Sphaerisporangium sp.]|jgi:hypothetical protein|nr:hypothetical protein [Sphaerisporangium sp.]